MDELVNLVSEKASISDSQAAMAVKTVMDFLNDKLPAPLGDQVKNALEGDTSANAVRELADGLGGLFSNK